MIEHKKEFYGGIGLFMGFITVLLMMFLPIFVGQNALKYLDALYNSISKGSAYYIPKMKEESAKFAGHSVSVKITMSEDKQAEQTARLFEAGGAEVTIKGAELQITGDLGKILENCLADADAMYDNDDEKVTRKYGYDERQVLFNWWKAFKEMEKALGKQKKFKEAKVIGLVAKKAVESSYNYYKIEPQKIGNRLGTVIFSLLFYVFYTLWYGFAVLFMFEGWGLRFGH